MERTPYGEPRGVGRRSRDASVDRGTAQARSSSGRTASDRPDPGRTRTARGGAGPPGVPTGPNPGPEPAAGRSSGVVTRRGALRLVAGATAAGSALAAGTSPAGAQDDPDFGGWFDDVDNYEGVVDRTGQGEVTVEVGAEGNGGPFAFAPAAVRVDPGTTVVFSWVSDTHNVVVESQPDGAGWEGSEAIENEGFEYEHAFETEGIYTYYCEPHLGVGMKGAVVVGGTGGAGGAGGANATTGGGGEDGSVEPDFGGWLKGVDGGYEDARGQGEVTVQVGTEGNGGAFAFAPAGLWVDPETTVVWEWTGEGGQHNVRATEGASFESDLVQEAGYTFEHAFEEGGIVQYQCDPHASLGMKGAVAVGDEVPTVGAGGGDAAGGPAGGGPGGDGGITLPGDAFARFFVPVVGSLLGLAVLLAVSPEIYDAITRPYRVATGQADATVERTTTMEAPPERIARVLGHEEFEPVGTAALIVGYFAILVLMWLFMYFVEFLGGGPTVIGP